jgi:protein TonB
MVVFVEHHGGHADVARFAGLRTILLPPDIVAVQRPLPAPVKKKAPWRVRPNGEPTEKAGGREWFGDLLFVEMQNGRMPAGLGASIGAHAVVLTIVIVLAMQFDRALVVRVGPPLSTPAMVFLRPLTHMPSGASRSIEQSPRAPARLAAAAPAAGDRPAAPLEAPESIEPETGAENGADGVEGGVAGGVDEGVVDGTVSAALPSLGPVRLGPTIEPPKKIKDVKPVYPQVAFSGQTRGAVVIEITIGTDGKVEEARVIHSVPLLDEAAVEAVRQWEYEKTRLNGVLVSLIMTVVVNFTIQ